MTKTVVKLVQMAITSRAENAFLALRAMLAQTTIKQLVREPHIQQVMQVLARALQIAQIVQQ